MNNQPHLITENGQTFELGVLKNNHITYDFDRIRAFLEFKGKNLFHKNFQLYRSDQVLLLKLCAWFLNDQNLCKKMNLDPGKGILLTGPVGCGKTSLMKLLQHLSHQRNHFEVIPVRNIAMEFASHGFPVIEKYGNSKSLCLDDLGIEPDIRYFGTECNTLGEVLLSRYDLFINHKIKTHATTNLNAKELEDRYGSRIRSRMRAMFNLIAIDAAAPDRRV